MKKKEREQLKERLLKMVVNEPRPESMPPITMAEVMINSMSKPNLEPLLDFISQELDRAREEGYKKGREDQQHLDGLLYGTTVATTTTLEEGWILKDKKKVEEELSKLTTK